MYLKQNRGWTDKMFKVLLNNVKYKTCGNFYGGGIIKLYRFTDIEEIEKTKEYKELREKADKRRKKVIETKKIEEEKRRLEKKQQLKNLAKFYEEEDYCISKRKDKQEFTKHKWQEYCLNTIESQNNIILTSPTGSGKTTVFLEWALKKKERPIFITSPIKSLSNQRYRELTKLGYIVGIETGDIKKVPINSEFICCTQEIYTNKYINIVDSTLIIDEFHYIFENQDRARTYIDSLKYSKAKNIFICSATLGNLNKVQKYINKVANRNFYLYENMERLTEIIYKNKINNKVIKNALVIAFSTNNCRYIANTLSYIRKEIMEVSTKCYTKYQENFEKIKSLAIKYNIKINELINIDYINIGLAVYYGSLLPKEKFFIEKIFEERLIDTIVGTDSLALGVNFPVQNVVFAQLTKSYEGIISKNLFQQLSGRAGRKGYFNTGYVYYCNDFYIDDNVEYLYKELLNKDNEDIKIKLTPIISKILKEITTIQEEVNYIVENSTEVIDIMDITDYINEEIKYIKTYNVIGNEKEKFKQNIARVYFDEYSPELNCYLFNCILQKKSIQQIIDNNYSNFKTFNSLLQLRKYLIHLPKEYNKRFYISSIEKKINDLDNLALNID